MQGTVGQLRPMLAVGNRISQNNASKTAFLFNKVSSIENLVELKFVSKFPAHPIV